MTDDVPPSAEATSQIALATGGGRKRLRGKAKATEAYEPATGMPQRHECVQENESNLATKPMDRESKNEGSSSVPPLLDEWRLVQGKTNSPFDAPELAPTILCGRVHGHPHLADGNLMWSSPVVWLDYGKGRVALTRSRRYLLGDPDPAFLTFLERRNTATSAALLSLDTTTTRRCYPNGP